MCTSNPRKPVFGWTNKKRHLKRMSLAVYGIITNYIALQGNNESCSLVLFICTATKLSYLRRSKILTRERRSVAGGCNTNGARRPLKRPQNGQKKDKYRPNGEYLPTSLVFDSSRIYLMVFCFSRRPRLFELLSTIYSECSCLHHFCSLFISSKFFSVFSFRRSSLFSMTLVYHFSASS